MNGVIIMLRLFVCVWVPEEFKEKILEFQEKIMKIPIKAKFVERENFHLTITFLGNVKEEEVNLIKNKLDLAVKNMKKFEISLSGLKVIPNESYVRVLGIKVSDNEKIVKLITAVGNLVGGDYYENTKLTLCRIKNIKDKKLLKNFIEKNRNIEIGNFEVKNLSLVKSVITKSGPIYETIHVSSLID